MNRPLRSVLLSALVPLLASGFIGVPVVWAQSQAGGLPKLEDQVAALQLAVANLQAALAAETEARQAADAALQNQVAGVQGAASGLQSSITTLQSQVAALQAKDGAQDGTLMTLQTQIAGLLANGTSEAFLASNSRVDVPNGRSTTVLTLTLPEGKYTLVGKGTGINIDHDASWLCRLRLDPEFAFDPDDTFFDTEATTSGRSAFSFAGVTSIPSGGAIVFIECGSGEAGSSIGDVHLLATRVTTIHGAIP